MTCSRVLRGIALLAVAVVTCPPTARASLPSPSTACSIGKAKAANTAFGCYLKQELRLASGGNGDPASCSERLVRRFDSLESKGACLTIDDDALAASRAETAASDVLDALGLALASTDEERRCIKSKTKLAARYATCQSTALTKRLTNSQRTNQDFSQCRLDHAAESAELDATGDCPTTGEAALVEQHSGRGYAFLPATLWDNPPMADAPLPHAYLPGAQFNLVSLERADFRDADLSGSVWTNANNHHGPTDIFPDFRGANFAGATLTSTEFDYGLLEGAEFATATLTRFRALDVVSCPASLPPQWGCYGSHVVGPTSVLRYGDLSGTDLSGADLSEAYLDNTFLDSTILHGVDLSNATILQSSFVGADMLGADLSGATSMFEINGSNLVDCPASLPSGWSCVHRNLFGSTARVTLCDLSGQDLTGLTLDHMYFSGCNLAGADFGTSVFTTVGFSNCNLTGASFVDAELYDSAFGSSDLTNADFTNANAPGVQWVNGTTCPDGVVGVNCCYHTLPGEAPAVCGP